MKSNEKSSLFKFQENLYDEDKYNEGSIYQHEDMDFVTKVRFEHIREAEIEFNSNYLEKKDSKNMEIVKSKIKNLKYIIAERITQKCHYEINELRNYINSNEINYDILDNNEHTNDNFNIFYKDFMNCSSIERKLIDKFDEKFEFLYNIREFQFQICKKNCIENKFHHIKDEYLTCFKQCFKYTHKIIDPSIENTLEDLFNFYSNILDFQSGEQSTLL
jgi:hypothetical protein